ncbi:MAG TPA: CPBP family intramembrane glutamic endopeptidase [Paenibacillus sp.]|uniref:CPBP family intramembrane glutamic endopeptidase n=1 Tax=Paenibacillus sp. TaxID=58172 RepID=UPI0028D6C7DA|nr:CPBP family intramembrane glutamic endopeptidase [Paenibacillus sp.]HUC92534.1 CPBP family intramembrane glutamic endopeptidase [Paenibacillus sp.]
MQQANIEPRWHVVYGLGTVCLAVFLLFQVIPSTASSFFSSESPDVIGETAAEQKASSFVRTNFGGTVLSAAAVHQSSKLLTGYLAKEKLTDAYDERYGGDYPLDTYQVEVRSTTGQEDRITRIHFVNVHMETGAIVAWNEVSGGPEADRAPLPYDAAVLAAKAFAEQRGFRGRELQVRGPADGGFERDQAVVIDVPGAKAGDARLELRILAAKSPDDSVTIVDYKPAFQVPDTYTAYVERQDRIASLMTFAGSLGGSLVLFVLAIVYAALARRHTSFLRGLVLTALFLLFYTVNNLNMYDGIRAGFGEEANAKTMTDVGIAVQIVFTLGIAVSVYFSLVGGDGLWRRMGRNLWVRRGEPGFGDHVWKAMKLGYWAAFIFLGLQTLIFIVLEKGMGVWATSDVTQSPLNFGIPWLIPLMAWAAAISEEAVYRMFGIAVFTKWFRSTAAAAIIPTVVWALGHVAYPIYPWTTRLIELTILGLLFCYLFVKFGFAAAVFAHAVINSILFSMPLIFMGTPVNVTAGLVYIVLPVAVAWIIRWYDRKFTPRNKKGRAPHGDAVTAPPEAFQ